MSNFYTDVICKAGYFTSVSRISSFIALEPVTRANVVGIITAARGLGIELMAFETYRSQARQMALYEAKATKLKDVGVHHYGLACDLVKVVNDEPSWKGDFSFLADMCKARGMIWGGDWGEPGVAHSFVDSCHVQRVRVADQAALFAGSWYPDDSYSPIPAAIA